MLWLISRKLDHIRIYSLLALNQRLSPGKAVFCLDLKTKDQLACSQKKFFVLRQNRNFV